jgi:hypothetical protein
MMKQRLSYSDQLKHPNWQRRRLEMLNGSGFSCSRCGNTESTLHVHHKRYVKGREVWEYGDDELAVLCESCHQDAHDNSDTLSQLLYSVPENQRLNILGIIAGAIYVATGNSSVIEREQSGIDPLMVMAGMAALKCSDLDLIGMDKLSEFLKTEVEESKKRRSQVTIKPSETVN